MKRFKQIHWRTVRRVAQVGFLIAFVWLFRKTEYTGVSEVPSAANVLFRLDPLVAVCATAAAKWIVPIVWPALILVVLTVLLGRFFCGWVCPLGTLLDGSHRLLPPRITPPARRWQRAKYALLVVIVIGAVFGFPLVGYFDPFALLVRGMTFALDPFWSRGVTTLFDGLYRHAPARVSDLSEPIYSALKGTALPLQQNVFLWGSISLAILVAVFALELLERRFWCRNLCPLAALLALLSRWSAARRLPIKTCKDCGACAVDCRMGAFDAEGRLMPEACNLCMDCVANCPHERAKVALRSPKKAPIALDPSRRAVLATLAAGFALPAFSWATRSDRPVHPKLIRPPGVLDERKFLDACVRCGECMKVCPTNGLQPALFEAGVEGVFSPRLVPRMGYCEFNCTLCSELCPTGAIPRLTQREKHIAVMGKAEFDRDHCLPFAKGKPCIVCEEHCPVPIKAIRFREAEATNEQGARVVVKQPYLVYDLCTGCGICEKKCPIEGLSAVRISRVEAVTPTQPGVPT